MPVTVYKLKKRMRKKLLLLSGILLISRLSVAGDLEDSIPLSNHFIHQLGMEVRPAYIIPTNRFLKGENDPSKALSGGLSAHLRYAFKFSKSSYVDRIYGGPYQGIGVAFYTFGNQKEIGNPAAVYLLQGGSLAEFDSRLSLNYEWNFGLSSGWHPYDPDSNPNNVVIGSKINAYLNTNLYLNWVLSSRIDLTSGITLTHFSNGNTRFPNAGLNTAGVKMALIYNFNRKESFFAEKTGQPPIPAFQRHFSYDVIAFGSWRRKGVVFNDNALASPETYEVMGFNFTSFYNIGYRLRTGISVDGVYDSSANIYTEDYIIPIGGEDPGYTFYKPPLKNQLALGISARTEYVMPFFSVNIGLGANVIHGGGDLKGLYQVLALKIETTRNSFIHIGYNLQNFKDPNYLMLGFGYRFHNRYPVFYR
jgi:hypothetical protein